MAKSSLLEELVLSENIWRDVVRRIDPLFANMPVEHVDPDPKHPRNWIFATDMQKVIAHVYKPETVIRLFEQHLNDIFAETYGFSVDLAKPSVVPTMQQAVPWLQGILPRFLGNLIPSPSVVQSPVKPTLVGGKVASRDFAKQLVQSTLLYLHFHELFHPTQCPRSEEDRERCDVAIKRGIVNAEPHLTGDVVVNKTGNVRNAIWDVLIDTFFAYDHTSGGELDQRLREEITKRDIYIGNDQVTSLPDGVVITWDMLEMTGPSSPSLFFPITRMMYGLLQCQDETLRENVFDYFRGKMGDRIRDHDLRQAVVGSLIGMVAHHDVNDLHRIGINKGAYIKDACDLYDHRGRVEGTQARERVVRDFTRIGRDLGFRYRSIEGLVEPLSRYIDQNKEERRDGSNILQQGEGNEQTPSNQGGGGAEQVVQSLLNQGDPDLNQILAALAAAGNKPGGQGQRNQRLRAMAIDAHYKKESEDLPVRSPRVIANSVSRGKVEKPVLVGERYITPQQLLNLNIHGIQSFQQRYEVPVLVQISPHQYKLIEYEMVEEDQRDFVYKDAGVLLPDNIIIRADASYSMGTDNYLGNGDSYDMLMKVVYGFTGSVANAAKTAGKDIQVVVVSYSNRGDTVVSKPVELQEFYRTPHNSAKKVLFNPQGGSTYHDLAAYQLAHRRCQTGQTLDIMITDGGFESDPNTNQGWSYHDETIAEFDRILADPTNTMLYFSLFQACGFSVSVAEPVLDQRPNFHYFNVHDFDELQRLCTGITIEYD
jgi:hypothetical protein